MTIIMKLAATGLFSGIILAGFLKLVEKISSKPVYVLLLNVDYIPILKDLQMNEALEITLHLIVSVILVIVLYFLFRKLDIHKQIYPYIVMNILIGGVLFFTTALSERTPKITDIAAIIFWIAGHLIYGAVVGIIILYLRLDADENKTKN